MRRCDTQRLTQKNERKTYIGTRWATLVGGSAQPPHKGCWRRPIQSQTNKTIVAWLCCVSKTLMVGSVGCFRFKRKERKDRTLVLTVCVLCCAILCCKVKPATLWGRKKEWLNLGCERIQPGSNQILIQTCFLLIVNHQHFRSHHIRIRRTL